MTTDPTQAIAFVNRAMELANDACCHAEARAHRLRNGSLIQLSTHLNSHASQQAAVMAGMEEALGKLLVFHPTDAALERAGHGDRYMDEASDAEKLARAQLSAYRAMKGEKP